MDNAEYYLLMTVHQQARKLGEMEVFIPDAMEAKVAYIHNENIYLITHETRMD